MAAVEPLVDGVGALVMTVIGFGGAIVFGNVVTPGGRGVRDTKVIDVRVVTVRAVDDPAVVAAVLVFTTVAPDVKVIPAHAAVVLIAALPHKPAELSTQVLSVPDAQN